MQLFSSLWHQTKLAMVTIKLELIQLS